jgi:drug/metabolite transporter (DMT)-like permease
MTKRTLIAFLYLLIFGSIVAYGAYVYALAKLPTSTVSLYAYVNPAVAVFLGWLILDEPLGWNALVAMIVIFAGVALVQTASKRKVVAEVQPLPERQALEAAK